MPSASIASNRCLPPLSSAGIATAASAWGTLPADPPAVCCLVKSGCCADLVLLQGYVQIVLRLWCAGLFPSWDILPKYIRWYSYLNPQRYAYAATMVNAFQSHPDAGVGPFTVRRTRKS